MNKTIKILLLVFAALCGVIALITIMTKHDQCPCCKKVKNFFQSDDYTVLPMEDHYDEV